jgi:AraC-like DNA-binding protein
LSSIEAYGQTLSTHIMRKAHSLEYVKTGVHMPTNPDSHLELPREQCLGSFVVHPFQIWLSEDLSDLRIAPREGRPLEGLLEHVYRFHCNVSSAVSRHDWKLTPPGRLELRVHYALLGMGTADPGCSFEKAAIDLQDPVIEELTLAVMTSLATGAGDSYTVACITKMLCARLSDMQHVEAATAVRRFEDWQLSVLMDALGQVKEEYISVPSIALRCRLSVCHFSRLFRATFGMPLHRYRVTERIKKAKSRLAETRDPISDIALECGFADQSSFTRRFTAIAGVSPAIWRRVATQEAMRCDVQRPQSRFANA